MINSRKIDDLHPAVAELCRDFVRRCLAEHGIDVLIISTYRDMNCQAELYAKGRTQPGRIVTQAKPGQSFHNYRLAFDFVPLVHGKCDWLDLDKFKLCGAVAKSIRLEWAGDWKHFKEWGHCQFTGGLTLTDLQNGHYLPDTLNTENT